MFFMLLLILLWVLSVSSFLLVEILVVFLHYIIVGFLVDFLIPVDRTIFVLVIHWLIFFIRILFGLYSLILLLLFFDLYLLQFWTFCGLSILFRMILFLPALDFIIYFASILLYHYLLFCFLFSMSILDLSIISMHVLVDSIGIFLGV